MGDLPLPHRLPLAPSPSSVHRPTSWLCKWGGERQRMCRPPLPDPPPEEEREKNTIVIQGYRRVGEGVCASGVGRAFEFALLGAFEWASSSFQEVRNQQFSLGAIELDGEGQPLLRFVFRFLSGQLFLRFGLPAELQIEFEERGGRALSPPK